MKSSGSCRICHRHIEGEWARAPRGPGGDDERLKMEREMAQGCCDAHLGDAALVGASRPTDIEDIRDHRSSGAKVCVWVRLHPDLHWQFMERRAVADGMPVVEEVLSTHFSQPDGSMGSLWLIGVRDPDGSRIDYRCLAGAAGDDQPVHLGILGIADQIMVRSLLDGGRRGLEPGRGL